MNNIKRASGIHHTLSIWENMRAYHLPSASGKIVRQHTCIQVARYIYIYIYVIFYFRPFCNTRKEPKHILKITLNKVIWVWKIRLLKKRIWASFPRNLIVPIITSYGKMYWGFFFSPAFFLALLLMIIFFKFRCYSFIEL